MAVIVCTARTCARMKKYGVIIFFLLSRLKSTSAFFWEGWGCIFIFNFFVSGLVWPGHILSGKTIVIGAVFRVFSSCPADNSIDQKREGPGAYTDDDNKIEKTGKQCQEKDEGGDNDTADVFGVLPFSRVLLCVLCALT